MIGALAGAARQLAQLAALAAAYFCARPLGGMFGPALARAINGPQLFGVVLATVLAFTAVWLIVRYAVGALLRILFRGHGANADGDLDRGLGFLIGAVKVTALLYVTLSALTFVEDNVSVAGKKFGLSPEGSLCFEVTRNYNLFTLTQFKPVRTLVEVAKASSDPKRARKLKSDPAFAALSKDPRFKRALNDPAMKAAVESGDYRTLLRNDQVLDLIQDPTTARRLEAAMHASE